MASKPTDTEIAEIKSAVASDAWPVFKKLLIIARDNARTRYESAPNDHRYYQGILDGIKEVIRGFEGYKNFVADEETKQGVAGGPERVIATVPPAL
jgi:hypothetical protein